MPPNSFVHVSGSPFSFDTAAAIERSSRSPPGLWMFHARTWDIRLVSLLSCHRESVTFSVNLWVLLCVYLRHSREVERILPLRDGWDFFAALNYMCWYLRRPSHVKNILPLRERRDLLASLNHMCYYLRSHSHLHFIRPLREYHVLTVPLIYMCWYRRYPSHIFLVLPLRELESLVGALNYMC